ncbi:electron transfer flavoprotein beta subunit [Caloramator fervidus]|uniref:Electron transfer flavoprotein small subunit n=1 Tax=Caloramator fervidus TaxID=29344 RepID=A0A1H5VEN0_9CLOT|nr:electron transfer flavoprotein subunit beta/FixA family protein [Caloramator fervidus]SEF85506.1 electron transfer flavoprotein beta subunit [Caloramator fervidus]
MKVVVCVKQVPDTNEVKIDPVKGTLIREGVPSIMNPDDKNALEEALRLKDEYGAYVTVITMGPPQAEKVLREALAMGADEAILLTDKAFAGADTWATSLTLAKAIEKIGYDLILAGRQAIDGDTAQVGPEIAEHLDIPQVTYVEKVELEGNTLRVKRALEDGYEIIKINMPCLLTCIKELNTPRYMNVYDIFTCYKKEIKVLTSEDLGLNKEDIGLLGSPTKVRKTFTKEPKGKGEIINMPPCEAAKFAVEKLKEKHYI